MAKSDPSPSPPAAADSSLRSPPKRDYLQPARAKIAELDESQLELLDRLRGLRQDIQSWTSEMETQAKACENEIFELKRRLNSELDQQRPMSAAPEIAEEIKDQGKLSTENAQASSQDGMDKNKSTDLRWRMMLYKVKALATRVT